jgi:hypothetical protein
VLLKNRLHSLQIHPGANDALPELLLDSTLGTDPVSQPSQNGWRGFVAGVAQYLNEFLVLRVQPIGVRAETSNLVKPSLDLSSLSLHLIPLSTGLSGISFSIFPKGLDMIDQPQVILIMKDDFPVSEFSEDFLPEFNTLFELLGREDVRHLFQRKTLLSQARNEERLTHQE